MRHAAGVESRATARRHQRHVDQLADKCPPAAEVQSVPHVGRVGPAGDTSQRRGHARGGGRRLSAVQALAELAALTEIRDELARRIDDMRAFEREYRAALRKAAADLIAELDGPEDTP